MLPQFPPDHSARTGGDGEDSRLAARPACPRQHISRLSKNGPLLCLDGRARTKCDRRPTRSGEILIGGSNVIPLARIYDRDDLPLRTGKHAFASIGFPGMICWYFRYMNDAGPWPLAGLTVTSARDGSSSFSDIGGMPYGLALRRVLEESATIDEAERLLRSLRRTTMENLAICDRRRCAVFEISQTKQIVVRQATEGILRLHQSLPHKGAGNGFDVHSL